MRLLLAIFTSLLIASSSLFSQSLSVFDIDTTNFPTMKAKFYASDAAGNQIKNLSPTDFEVIENGIARTVTNVSCPVPTTQRLSIVFAVDVTIYNDINNVKSVLSAWLDLIPLNLSEIAIMSYDGNSYINQDFTTDKNKLQNSINALVTLSSSEDHTGALIRPITGAIAIAKNGKYKPIVIVLSSCSHLDQKRETSIIDEAKKNDVTINFNIFNKYDWTPEICQHIARETGGFANNHIPLNNLSTAITSINKILSVNCNNSCKIEWQSGIYCTAGITNATIKLIPQNLTQNASYQSPNTTVAKLEFNPKSIKFENPAPGVYTPAQKVTVTARNADFTINDITTKIPVGFEITPKNFPITLKAGQSMDFTVTYFPADSGYNHCKFDVDCVPCATKFYVSGGWKGKKPTKRTIKLIHPNGGEVFVAGSNTVITWEGVSPDEPVKLEYRTDDNQPWISIADKATGLSYTWRVPKTPSDQCLAIVTAAAKSITTSDIEMVPIPAGTFQMGNTGAHSGYGWEKPVHTVTISRNFLMSKTEITQMQYEAVMGTNPSRFKGDNLPVETVNWYDAVAFCNKLSELEGLKQCYTINGTDVTCNWDAYGYRLPTNAEWEYAAKAGTSTDFYSGSLTNPNSTPIDANLDLIGWYSGNSNNTTHPVGQKQPNAFGLYDMSGNVWEWCWDWYSAYLSTAVTDPTGPLSGFNRLNRGGSWMFYADYSRSASLSLTAPSKNYSSIGFRIVSPS